MPDDAPPIETAMLRPFLAGRDVPCPGCGYNVRDLPTDVCPECGQQLRLHLGLAEPKQAALIAGLVGLAAGAGFGGLLVVYLIVMIVRYGDQFGGELSRFFWITGSGCAIHAVAIAAWVWQWNAIRRRSARVRWLLVALCFAMPLAFVAIFAATVR